MAEPLIIENVEMQTKVTMKASSTCRRGNLIGYSSGWVQADADAASNIYAQFVALEDGDADAITGAASIAVCKRCVFYDGDEPYTANTAQYVSGTAGGITETRPATDGDLIQVVGRSLDGYRVQIEIKPPYEWEMMLIPSAYDETNEGGLGTVDTGWVGSQIDAAEEDVYFTGRLPSGIVGDITIARALFNNIGASAFDCDVHITGAYDSGANNQDTGTSIVAGDWDSDTDNDIAYMNVAACFDSGFYTPGRNFSLNLDPDAITGDAQAIGLYLRGWKV